ncbi:MAG: ABC transporter substrate-binding protein [Chloroflexota bacterium]|nr:ABC transporter substrate-binding protein [Chloroflexota bacterium]
MAGTLDRRTMIKLAGGSTAAMLAGTAPKVVVGQDTVPAGGELVIGKGQEAVGLDPALETAASSHDLIAATYERLVDYGESGEPQPQLAVSWEIPDDLTYIFSLRPDVTFHNGQPMTSEDVKYTFDRITDEAMASPWATQFAPLEAVEATDELTVTFRLSEPYGPLLATLAAVYASIVPADESIDLQTEMVGTGPFMLESWEQDFETVMSAYGGYWEPDEPQVETLRWRILPDESARLAAVRTGEIHITELADPLVVESATQSENVRVVEQETTDYYLLGFNTAVPPFDDPKVRRALSMAIDRQAIVDAVFFGRGQVTGPIVPTLGDWAQPIEQLPTYEVDREQARQLLEEAGHSDLSFSIMAGALYKEFVNIALVIQDQLSEIGVTVELDQVEWGTFIERWRERDFQSFVSFNGSGNDPDRALYPAFVTDGSVNAFQFSDEEIDRMLESARTTTDPEARKSIYQNIEVALAEEAPAIFIATRVALFAVREAVRGFQPTPVDEWATLGQTTVGTIEE